MNDALSKYKHNSKVFQISGYSYPVKSLNDFSLFFTPNILLGVGHYI